MYTIAVFMSIVLTLLLFIVGGIVGWIVTMYLNSLGTQQPFLHPEFFDSNGNVIPDEIIAVRITPKLNIEEDYYDTDDSNEEAEDYS